MNKEQEQQERRKNSELAAKIVTDGNLMDASHAVLFSPISFQVAIIDFVKGFIFNLLRMACVPAELIVRRNFGERHFNLYIYIGGAMWLWIWAMGFISLPFGLSGEPNVPNEWIFGAVGTWFFGAMAWQLLLRKSFTKVDYNRYSYYDGDVLPFLYKLPFAKDKHGHPQESRVRQIHEPLFMIIMGVVIAYVLNPQTGTWLIVSALGMAVKMYAQAQQDRSQILDQIDADIMARSMAGAMKGVLAQNNNGVYIAGLPTDKVFREKFTSLTTKKRFSTADHPAPTTPPRTTHATHNQARQNQAFFSTTTDKEVISEPA